MTVTEVKICGITSLEDAERVAALGVWAIGLNFWPGSRRRCRRDVAAEIAAGLRRRLEVAGIFVNAQLDEVARTAENVGLTVLQLHGDEGPSYCAEAARRTGCKVIKATRVRSRADIQALEAFHTDYHLLDSWVTGTPGGTGHTFSWEIARSHWGSVPVILSGGLTPDNVAEAIATVRPFAVDVASGVEAQAGVKDPGKLKAFVDAVAAHAPPPGSAHARSRGSAHVPTRTPI